MERQSKSASLYNRGKKKRNLTKSPFTMPNLSKEISKFQKAESEDNIKLLLILRFQVEEYLSKVVSPQDLRLHWRCSPIANPIELAKSHLQKISTLAQFDYNNLIKHFKYLSKVTSNLSYVIDATCIEFEGLTKDQVRACASNKKLDFEIIEFEC